MYKILLAGGNRQLIDEFFEHGGNMFEFMTTSLRYQDIASHIKYFQPDILVYCLKSESRDVFSKILSVKGKWLKLPFVLILSEEDCEEWKGTAGAPADMLFQMPIRLNQVMHEIKEYLNKLHPAVEQMQPVREQSAKEQSDNEAQSGRPPAAGMPQEAAAEQTRTHILVVDDDITMLRTIKGHLEGQFDVATAPSGRVALKFLESKTTDLILLDYEMPEENGVVVLEKLRANPATKNIPVVFLTGITEQHKIKKAIAMKPQGYLLKPIDHEKLLSEITNILRKYHK